MLITAEKDHTGRGCVICVYECQLFSSYFRKVTNISFSDYVTRMRINHARELLREGKKNVTEIAMECGFNNISNFYRLYKKHVGKTPKDEKSKNS